MQLHGHIGLGRKAHRVRVQVMNKEKILEAIINLPSGERDDLREILEQMWCMNLRNRAPEPMIASAYGCSPTSHNEVSFEVDVELVSVSNKLDTIKLMRKLFPYRNLNDVCALVRNVCGGTQRELLTTSRAEAYKMRDFFAAVGAQLELRGRQGVVI